MDPARTWRLSFLLCGVILLALQGSASGDDPRVRSCSKNCGTNGCAGISCLSSCHYLNSTGKQDSVGDMLSSLPLYRRWKDWVCSSECNYHCLLIKDAEDAGADQAAIGFRKNWCLARVMAKQESSNALYRHLAKSALTPGILHLGLINEPASVVLSSLNVLVNLLGLGAFLKLVHYGLPKRPIVGGPSYPFAGLWTIYGVLVTSYWLARCVLHARSIAFDEHIESTAKVVLGAYALMLAIVRVGDMRSEQSRVVVICPSVAFLGPHLMYINICTFDYGLNIQVCLVLGAIQLLLWLTWATYTKHPGRYQLYLLALLAPLTFFLRLYDFNYLWKGLDADTLWIASAIPSSFFWWSFARVDASYQTNSILKKRHAKTSESEDPKKEQ